MAEPQPSDALDPSPQSAPHRARDPLSWVLVVFLVLNLVAVVWLVLMMGAGRDRLQQLERAVRLYEYERVPPAGYAEAFGFKALLQHLVYWAPRLQVADPTRDRDAIEAKVRGIVAAMAARADFYPLIEDAFLSPGPLTKDAATSDEVRRWLLLAARGADSQTGTQLVLRTLQNQLPEKVPASDRLRWLAADILLAGREQDKLLAGEALHDIITKEREGGAEGSPDGSARFFNFVSRYQDSGHPRIEHTMLMLLGRREHNRMTIQTAVEYLGRIKSEQAIEPVKRLFQSPPWRGGDNALFRATCLTALDEIMGGGIEPFLEEASRTETDAFVRNRIDALRKKYSGSGNGNNPK